MIFFTLYSEVIGSSVSLTWNSPKDDGNTEIIGYIIEKRDKKTARADGQWYLCIDKCRHRNCQITDLIMGNSYQFRVRAFNEVGIGAESFTAEFAEITKDLSLWVKPEVTTKNIDFKPEFTTGINSRNLVQGYNGVLTCAVKGGLHFSAIFFRYIGMIETYKSFYYLN